MPELTPSEQLETVVKVAYEVRAMLARCGAPRLSSRAMRVTQLADTAQRAWVAAEQAPDDEEAERGARELTDVMLREHAAVGVELRRWLSHRIQVAMTAAPIFACQERQHRNVRTVSRARTRRVRRTRTGSRRSRSRSADDKPDPVRDPARARA